MRLERLVGWVMAVGFGVAVFAVGPPIALANM